MAKEWILNSVTNRFQLNYSRNVGTVSEEIRKCSPKSVDEWRNYYYANVRGEEHLAELGRKLYTKISEVIVAEVDEVSEDDCISYIKNLVIERTFDGYETEKKTIYEQLEKILSVKIEPAPDKWDRLFNVDFFIKLSNGTIGLQIKPISETSHIPQIYKERELQKISHKKFSEKYGGKVFYIFSIKLDRKKIIANPEIIDEIKTEIERLSKP